MSGKLLQIFYRKPGFSQNVSSREKIIRAAKVLFPILAVVYLGITAVSSQKPWFNILRLTFWLSLILLFIPVLIKMIFFNRKR